MSLRLLTGVSSLVLALGTASALAGEAKAVREPFSTEVPGRPAVAGQASETALPASPAQKPGVTGVAERPGLRLDPVTTGQIPNRDAETAADNLKVQTHLGSAPGAVETVEPPDDDAPDSPLASGSPAPAPGASHGEAAGSPESASSAGEGVLPAAAEQEHPSGEGARHGEGAVSPAAAAVRSPMPFDVIRTIEFLQDQVARGNGRAIRVQAMLLQRFGPVFEEADPAVWSDNRNFRAAVLFVLSGGPSAILRQLTDRASLDGERALLAKGALAYIDNNMPEAEKALSALDFKDMEPGLAAHVNLVLGQIKQLDQPEEAVRHLDQARLLSPGGLIEESALRMEVLLVDGLGRHEAADQLARRYFDRYSRSAYAENFEARFATLLAGRGRTDAPSAVATMLDLTARLTDESKRTLFLAVGRRALVEGNLEFANLTANEALRTGDVSDADKQRANLYTVAATVGSSAATEAAGELGKIDRSKLYPEDANLLDAAYSILKGIDQVPELGEAPSSSDRYAETSPVFDRAQQLLNEVASDLGKARP